MSRWEAAHARARALSFRGGPEAIDAAHEALRLATEEVGEDSIATFEAASTLAGAYTVSHDSGRALRFYSMAVKIGERIRAPAVSQATQLSFLAFAHSARREVEDAKRACERALILLEESGEHDATAAKILANIGAVHGNLGDSARAAALYTRAETILEPRSHGSSDAALEAQVDLGRAYSNHARIAHESGEIEDATRLLMGALSALERQRAARLTPHADEVDILEQQAARLRASGGHLEADFTARLSALRRSPGC